VKVAEHGACGLTIGHIAALAGVSETTVRNAIREAKALGLVTVEERRKSAWVSYPNLVRIVSPEWASWLRLHGCKSVKPTDSRYKNLSESRSAMNPQKGWYGTRFEVFRPYFSGIMERARYSQPEIASD
jgi:hypothetical protein